MEKNNIDKAGGRDIDLIDVALRIWAKRKLIFRNCGIAAVLGIIIAFSIPKEYESEVTLVPEDSSEKAGLNGSLGSLAAMAGINLGGATGPDAISPDLYPDILESTPFLVGLFNVKVKTEKGNLNTTLYDYMKEHQKSAWFSYVISAPFKLLGWGVSLFKEKPPKGDPAHANYFNLTLDQEKTAKSIYESMSVIINKKTGVIMLSVRMQDPLIAATVADTIKDRLKNYIIDYRTSKARKDLVFTEKLYKEAQKSYTDAQQAYATYMDGNIDVVLERYKAEQTRLENEEKLAYQVYSQIAQQLQLAKAKVQEKTPVYTVVQPAVMSKKAASPKKISILLVFCFLGFIGTSAWILLKDKLKISKK